MTKIGVRTGLLVALLSACTVGSVGCDGGGGKKDGGPDAKSDAKTDTTTGPDVKADASVDTTPTTDAVVTPDVAADVTPDVVTTPDAAVDVTPAVDMAADRTPDAVADVTPTTDATTDTTPTTDGSTNDGAVVTRSIGGNISGLLGTGIVLRNNGGDSLPLTPGATSFPFTFATRLPVGATYNVTVQTQPSSPSQTCDVVNGSGTVGATNITNIAITCTTRTFTVTGTIAGYAGTGLVLQNNGAGNITVAANATTFAFPAQASGSTYAVTVLTQPTSPPQICTVANGTGTVGGANVTGITVTCATQVFTVGGTISGLTGTGLVLRNNGGDNETVAAGATSFTFDTSLATGSPYAVTILTQPAGQTCTVNTGTGSGTVGSANVTSPAITCVSTYTVGGTIAGLTGSGLVLQNNLGDNVTVPAAATTFTFPTRLASGAYSVTVLTQPSSPAQTCTVAMGSGTVSGANVSNVAITCTTSYTVGGMISGLTAAGLVLRNNGGNDLTVPANATSFTFTNPLAPNATYNVTVQTNPTGLVCMVTGGGMGTVTTANVTNVAIACTPRYTVSGTISGLTTGGLILRVNGIAANDVMPAANATSYAFTAPLLAMGDAYAVTVQQQPTGGITCTAAAGGTVGTTAPTVAITCTNAPATSVCFYGTEAAGGNAVLTCPGDSTHTITGFTFVSFGDPTGTCPGPFTLGSCNSTTAPGVVSTMCMGQHTCSVPVSFATLGDACPGTAKALAVIATCN